ncbi:hypothetical protein RJT34_12891 [Clitoria ternatea]|uniref:rRNA biogenesis protein RRP36 n=1 Tax=Clitoria ternatea TaxID=43366 RepID=A0AAN9PL78_CLITE
MEDSMETQYNESEIDESSSSSSSEDEEEDDEIEKELADVKFEELQKARSNGAHIYTDYWMMLWSNSVSVTTLPKQTLNGLTVPMEASSKKPVSSFREVIQAPKKVVRDPRFESLCGKLDDEGFRKRYNFLFENDLPAERQALRKELKKYRDPKRINEIEERISWIDKQLKSGSAKQIDAEILARHKKKEREATKQGKRPFYLKKCNTSPLHALLSAPLLSLIHTHKNTSSGKLEAFIENRRRRNAAKDHRYMPYRRTDDSME